MDSLHIDVETVIRQRLPRQARYIPRFLIKGLERFIHQDDMNRMLQATAGLRGEAFCHAVLSHLDIRRRIDNPQLLPQPADSRVIFVCNHPLGGLDGLTLIELLSAHFGQEVRFVVNDLLLAVTPLTDVFLPVNKHGRQQRSAATLLDDAFESDRPIIVFPAGLVSRRDSSGRIADLKWHKMFINRAIKHRRDVIPLYFSGRNSNFFYTFANLRRRLGIKFNLEMTRLPAEVFRCRGAAFQITVGDRIGWRSLSGGSAADAEASRIRDITYKLNDPTK